MNDLEFAINKLKSGDLFFFAGSGISYASNLPSAPEILRRSVSAFLSNDASMDEKESICKNIQPEVFYEAVISMTQTNDCLHIWRSLHGKTQTVHDVDCIPDLAHLFIVKYSQKNRLPVITTNFDSMFERACDLMGLDYKILLPTDDPSAIDQNSLCICKIHGSIQNKEGDYSPQSLWTTMTQITTVNTRWIEYIVGLMNTRHLCFVGYSGRDIDFFPYLSEAPNKEGAKRIVWVNRFDGDHSDGASIGCNAVRVHKWPREWFESVLHLVDVSNCAGKFSPSRQGDNLGKMLDQLENELGQMKLLSSCERELLNCLLLAKIGLHRRAYEIAVCLEKNKIFNFTRHANKCLLLLTSARLSHELSKFDSCRTHVSKVLRVVNRGVDYDLNVEIQARCLRCEVLRMDVPNDMYFPMPKGFGDYFYASYVVWCFMYAMVLLDVKMKFYGLLQVEVFPEARHEFIEHQVRFYSIMQAMTGLLGLGRFDFFKRFLIGRWDGIRKKSYQAGYAAGIANSGKFKYRLTFSEETRDDSAYIYQLTKSVTGVELLVKNVADQLLLDRRFDESRIKFIELADMARANGNALNEIKAIAGYACCNHRDGKQPLLSDSLRARYRKLVDLIESKRWKGYLIYVDRVVLDCWSDA